MNYDKTMEMLGELYAIALENKDVQAGLEVVDSMIRAGASRAPAGAKKKVTIRQT